MADAILFRSTVRSIKNVKIQWFPHPVIPSQKVMKGTEINKRFLFLFLMHSDSLRQMSAEPGSSLCRRFLPGKDKLVAKQGKIRYDLEG